ncbi:unnamed protein product [Amoebophrya sp. A120]|nr:unnamed protein product [Amoebophrya sp. A120]|eukprot:GSA120T00016078001.1
MASANIAAAPHYKVTPTAVTRLVPPNVEDSLDYDQSYDQDHDYNDYDEYNSDEDFYGAAQPQQPSSANKQPRRPATAPVGPRNTAAAARGRPTTRKVNLVSSKEDATGSRDDEVFQFLKKRRRLPHRLRSPDRAEAEAKDFKRLHETYEDRVLRWGSRDPGPNVSKWERKLLAGLEKLENHTTRPRGVAEIRQVISVFPEHSVLKFQHLAFNQRKPMSNHHAKRELLFLLPELTKRGSFPFFKLRAGLSFVLNHLKDEQFCPAVSRCVVETYKALVSTGAGVGNPNSSAFNDSQYDLSSNKDQTTGVGEPDATFQLFTNFLLDRAMRRKNGRSLQERKGCLLVLQQLLVEYGIEAFLDLNKVLQLLKSAHDLHEPILTVLSQLLERKPGEFTSSQLTLIIAVLVKHLSGPSAKPDFVAGKGGTQRGSRDVVENDPATSLPEEFWLTKDLAVICSALLGQIGRYVLKNFGNQQPHLVDKHRSLVLGTLAEENLDLWRLAAGRSGANLRKSLKFCQEVWQKPASATSVPSAPMRNSVRKDAQFSKKGLVQSLVDGLLESSKAAAFKDYQHLGTATSSGNRNGGTSVSKNYVNMDAATAAKSLLPNPDENLPSLSPEDDEEDDFQNSYNGPEEVIDNSATSSRKASNSYSGQRNINSSSSHLQPPQPPGGVVVTSDQGAVLLQREENLGPHSIPLDEIAHELVNRSVSRAASRESGSKRTASNSYSKLDHAVLAGGTTNNASSSHRGSFSSRGTGSGGGVVTGSDAEGSKVLQRAVSGSSCATVERPVEGSFQQENQFVHKAFNNNQEFDQPRVIGSNSFEKNANDFDEDQQLFSRIRVKSTNIGRAGQLPVNESEIRNSSNKGPHHIPAAQEGVNSRSGTKLNLSSSANSTELHYGSANCDPESLLDYEIRTHLNAENVVMRGAGGAGRSNLLQRDDLLDQRNIEADDHSESNSSSAQEQVDDNQETAARRRSLLLRQEANPLLLATSQRQNSHTRGPTTTSARLVTSPPRLGDPSSPQHHPRNSYSFNNVNSNSRRSSLGGSFSSVLTREQGGRTSTRAAGRNYNYEDQEANAFFDMYEPQDVEMSQAAQQGYHDGHPARTSSSPQKGMKQHPQRGSHHLSGNKNYDPQHQHQPVVLDKCVSQALELIQHEGDVNTGFAKVFANGNEQSLRQLLHRLTKISHNISATLDQKHASYLFQLLSALLPKDFKQRNRNEPNSYANLLNTLQWMKAMVTSKTSVLQQIQSSSITKLQQLLFQATETGDSFAGLVGGKNELAKHCAQLYAMLERGKFG